jgi:hypothetical protein
MGARGAEDVQKEGTSGAYLREEPHQDIITPVSHVVVVVLLCPIDSGVIKENGQRSPSAGKIGPERAVEEDDEMGLAERLLV